MQIPALPLHRFVMEHWPRYGDKPALIDAATGRTLTYTELTEGVNNVAANLAALVLGMLMLAYASVPLYRLFCEVTGYGGTTMTGQYAAAKVLDRTLTIAFNADTDPNLPWAFAPGEKSHTA